MNPKCVYEVKTKYFGTVRLDEGAYRDYLAGTSWVCFGMKDIDKSKSINAPINTSPQALELREKTKNVSPYMIYGELRDKGEMIFPYRESMSQNKVSMMVLTVRSTNALRREKIETLGQLNTKITSDFGIRSIRNLGEKSEKEILKQFFNHCYYLLNEYEKALFWQEVINHGIN